MKTVLCCLLVAAVTSCYDLGSLESEVHYYHSEELKTKIGRDRIQFPYLYILETVFSRLRS